MEFKGTKGKWIIAPNNVNIWADNTKVANCDNNSQASMYRIKDEEEMKYNALLISKSPLLLKAIKDSINELREVGLNDMANYHEKLYNECVNL